MSLQYKKDNLGQHRSVALSEVPSKWHLCPAQKSVGPRWVLLLDL